MAQIPTLTIEAGNPAGLAKFYLALGFTEVTSEDDRVELDRAGLRLSILRGPVTGPGRTDLPVRGLQLTVQVDDLEAIRPALLAAGGDAPDAYRSDWSGTVILDPDGSPVRILTPAVPTKTAPASAAPTSPPAGTAPAQPAERATEADPAAPAATTPAATAPAASAEYDDPNLPQSPLPATYYNDSGVPTFDAVAERIQRQSATADGNEILDAESQRGREESDAMDKLKKAGQDRLNQLRKSLGM